MADLGVDLGEADDPSPPKEPWWERKLSLLLIGFILTGILGTGLQVFQKTLEWRRQTGFQVYTRKLTAMQKMREDLTKVYVTGVLISEQLEQFKAHPSAKPPTPRIPDSQLHQDRLRQTASLYVGAEVFPDPGGMKLRVQRITGAWKALTELYEDALSGTVRLTDTAVADRYTATVKLFDENYDALRREIETQIGRFEDANKDFKF